MLSGALLPYLVAIIKCYNVHPCIARSGDYTLMFTLYSIAFIGLVGTIITTIRSLLRKKDR